MKPTFLFFFETDKGLSFFSFNMGHKHSILKDNIAGLIPKGQVLQHIPTKASCEEAAAMLRNSGVRSTFHRLSAVFSHKQFFFFFF